MTVASIPDSDQRLDASQLNAARAAFVEGSDAERVARELGFSD